MIDGPANLLQFGETDWLDIIGRLAPGADPKTIETQMQLELRQWLLGPESKLQPGERALVPNKPCICLRASRSADDARRVPVGPAPADVGFRFCVVDRLCQCGEPDAGAGCQPAAKHFRAYRTGRTQVGGSWRKC